MTRSDSMQEANENALKYWKATSSGDSTDCVMKACDDEDLDKYPMSNFCTVGYGSETNMCSVWEAEVNELRVSEMKNVLRRLNMSDKGKKKELGERLNKALHAKNMLMHFVQTNHSGIHKDLKREEIWELHSKEWVRSLEMGVDWYPENSTLLTLKIHQQVESWNENMRQQNQPEWIYLHVPEHKTEDATSDKISRKRKADTSVDPDSKKTKTEEKPASKRGARMKQGSSRAKRIQEAAKIGKKQVSPKKSMISTSFEVFSPEELHKRVKQFEKVHGQSNLWKQFQSAESKQGKKLGEKFKNWATESKVDLSSFWTFHNNKSDSVSHSLKKKEKRRKKRKLKPPTPLSSQEQLKTPNLEKPKKKKCASLDKSMDISDLPSKRYSDLADEHPSMMENSEKRQSDLSDHLFHLSQGFDGEQPDAGIQILTQNANANDRSFEDPPSQTFSEDNLFADEDNEGAKEGSAPPQSPPAEVTNPFAPGGPMASKIGKESSEEEAFPEDVVEPTMQKMQAEQAKKKKRSPQFSPKESPLQKKPDIVDLTKGKDEALPLLTVEQAKALQVGNRVDLKDVVYRWLPAEVIERKGDTAVFQFDGWAKSYNVTRDLTGETGILAPIDSHSKGESDRLKDLEIGGNVDVKYELRWYEGTVKKFHWERKTKSKESVSPKKLVSPQIQVTFKQVGHTKLQIRWFDRRSEDEVAKAGAHTAKPKKRVSQGYPTGFSYSYEKRSSEPSKPEKWKNPYKLGEWVEYKSDIFASWSLYEIEYISGEEMHIRGAYNRLKQVNARKERKNLQQPSEASLKRGRASKTATRIKFQKSLKAKFNRNWIVNRADGDGNCLFRTIAWAVLGDQKRHDETRKKCVEHIWRERLYCEEFFWDEEDTPFLDKMKSRIKPNGEIWGDHRDITALAAEYNVVIEVYEWDVSKQTAYMSAINPAEDDANKHILPQLPVIRVARERQIHYDLIVDTDVGPTIKNYKEIMKKAPRLMDVLKVQRKKAMEEQKERDERNRKEREAEEAKKKKEVKKEPTGILDMESSDSSDGEQLGAFGLRDAKKAKDDGPPDPLGFDQEKKGANKRNSIDLTLSDAESGAEGEQKQNRIDLTQPDMDSDAPEKPSSVKKEGVKLEKSGASVKKEKQQPEKSKPMTFEETTTFGLEQLQLAFEGKDKPKRKFSPIKIDGDKQEWPCRHCTTKNKMSALACSTCSKPRFEAATSTWSCKKCTLSNPAKNVKCSVCDYERKKINCPGCTLEYFISKRRCMCGTANPAYKPPTFGRSGTLGSDFRYSDHFRHDPFNNLDCDYSKWNNEYDPDIFASIVYNEDHECYVDEDGGLLDSMRAWEAWYDAHEKDYIVVIGTKDNLNRQRRLQLKHRIVSREFQGPYLLAGTRRALHIAAYLQKESTTFSEYYLVQQLNEKARNFVRKSFHAILEKAVKLSEKQKLDGAPKQRIYLLEDKNGTCRYGAEPVKKTYRRRDSFSSSGKKSKSKKKSIRNGLNKTWFKELKGGSLTHERIEELSKGKKKGLKDVKGSGKLKQTTLSRKRNGGFNGGASKKRKLANKDCHDLLTEDEENGFMRNTAPTHDDDDNYYSDDSFLAADLRKSGSRHFTSGTS